MKIAISLAVATANGAIGFRGGIPWDLPEDRKLFRRVTMGHPVIMGRATWESLLPRGLPGRQCVVVSKQHFPSLDSAIESIRGAQKAFVIGGTRLFHEAASIADEVHLTHVREIPEADTFVDLNRLHALWANMAEVERMDVSSSATQATYVKLVRNPIESEWTEGIE